MKTLKIIIISVCLIFLFSSCSNSGNSVLCEVVGEYDVSTLATDFGGDLAYEIGSNINGMPVFKNPDRAFKQALIDYSKGFLATAKEYDLDLINKSNYDLYKTYGWQLTNQDDEIQAQGTRITQFFDIYENSFK